MFSYWGKLKNYFYLMRLNKPIGIFLLLWPTLWALWLAKDGEPDLMIVMVFVVGVIIMRSAGCIINDLADRNFDGFVKRTSERPLVSQRVSVKEALALFSILIIIAFLLALSLSGLTVLLAVVGVLLAISYPFLKRVTHLPQIGLGISFSWGVPMAFVAELNQIPMKSWVLFLAAATWPVIYDSYYAMVDRDDDIKIGLKSTAILFGKYDLLMIGLLQCLFIALMMTVGWLFNLHLAYYISLCFVAVLFFYQQRLARHRDRSACFKAFSNNHWVGLIIFVGVVLSYWI